MTDPALQSYIDKWLAAHPAQRVSLPFITGPRRPVYLAMAALEQELVSAAYGISEAQVAATKLNWWAEELGGAVVGGGRHPLVQTLFADDAVRAIEPARWLTPVTAALNQLGAATPADFATQLETAETFHGGLAVLETRVWFGTEADSTRAARIATLDHMLQGVTRLPERVDAESLPLPMACLARHGLDRASMARDSAERRSAVREQLQSLAAHWREARHFSGPLSTFRGLEDRLDRHWLRRTARAQQPLHRLRKVQRRQTGLATLFRAWPAARASRAASIE